MKRILITVITAAMACCAASCSAALKVVTTTPELESIAKSIGGAHVSMVSLARPDQDYHKVEARPTDVTRVASADVVVRVGMDLDLWMDGVLQAARNRAVMKGGTGYVDASEMIRRQEVPRGQISGASGDIHVEGNPHYWLDPGNGKVIAYEILLGLRKVDPAHASAYDSAYRRFSSEIDAKMGKWDSELRPLRGRPVVAYHDEWVYFYRRFDLKAFGYLEPKPGIPPSAGHVSHLITEMKGAGVKLVLVPSIYPLRFPEMVAKETGAKVARVPYSVGSMGTESYIDYIDAIVAATARAGR